MQSEAPASSHAPAPNERNAASVEAPSAAPITTDALPDELLLLVFAFLGSDYSGGSTLIKSVPAVCRRWRALCPDTRGVHLDLAPGGAGDYMPRHKNHIDHVHVALALVQRWKHVTHVHLDEDMSIDIGSISDISDRIVQAIAPHCPELTEVNAKLCYITDASLISLATHCPRLTEVNFNGSDDITDVGMISLAEQCMLLEIISCQEVDITDAGLLAIATHCPKLAVADFSFIDNFTDTSVAVLAERCPKLEVVDFSHSSGVTGASLHAFAQPLASDGGLQCLELRRRRCACAR